MFQVFITLTLLLVVSFGSNDVSIPLYLAPHKYSKELTSRDPQIQHKLRQIKTRENPKRISQIQQKANEELNGDHNKDNTLKTVYWPVQNFDGLSFGRFIHARSDQKVIGKEMNNFYFKHPLFRVYIDPLNAIIDYITDPYNINPLDRIDKFSIVQIDVECVKKSNSVDVGVFQWGDEDELHLTFDPKFSMEHFHKGDYPLLSISNECYSFSDFDFSELKQNMEQGRMDDIMNDIEGSQFNKGVIIDTWAPEHHKPDMSRISVGADRHSQQDRFRQPNTRGSSNGGYQYQHRLFDNGQNRHSRFDQGGHTAFPGVPLPPQ